MNIYDISHLAGVSIATVSRVINGSDRVSEKTRKNVLRVMEENGYTPNAFARGLGLDTMRTIGLLCADASDPYLALAVNELEQHLRQNGYDCLLCCTGYSPREKEQALKLLQSKRVDGVIFVGSHFIESDAGKNSYILDAARDMPVMLLGGELEGGNIYCTLCDEGKAMEKCVRRFAENGREKILYLYNSMSYSGRHKLAGYKAAHRALGLEIDPARIKMLDAYQFDVNQVRQMLCQAYDEGLRFDAILTADDRLAVGGIKFAKARALRIPQDVAIIGCNNSAIARYCDPELTSIDNRLMDLCRQCVGTLMTVLDGEAAAQRTVFEASLVQRETTDFQ